MDEAAELLGKSKTNVRMVISKLEIDLGRQLDVPRRSTQGDDGKLLLVRLRKRSRSELTPAGKIGLHYNAQHVQYVLRDPEN